MRLALTTVVTTAALAGALVAPAAGVAKAPSKAAGRSATALRAPRHHPAPGRPGRPTAHASSFYYGVSSYCYGRTVSNGGGGYVVFSLNQLADFGFAPGTYVRWRPWVVWSNSRGSVWYTEYSGYFGYTVMNSGATGNGTIDASGTTVIGGTAAPGVWTTASLGIAPRTWARPYLELIINGRTYWNPLTPDHGDWPTYRSGDWCSFA
jgi:hypothetical protein